MSHAVVVSLRSLRILESLSSCYRQAASLCLTGTERGASPEAALGATAVCEVSANEDWLLHLRGILQRSSMGSYDPVEMPVQV